MQRGVRGLSTAAAVVCMLFSPSAARAADAVLDWNAIAVTVTTSQGPFGQARLLAITQLAVFEAVNAVTDKYEPYLGTIAAPPGASADAAAIAAAHTVLKNYLNALPGVGATLDAARAASLAAIPDGRAKTRGIATGEAAAAAMIMRRAGRWLGASRVLHAGVARSRRVAADANLPGGGRRLLPVAQRHAVRYPERWIGSS